MDTVLKAPYKIVNIYSLLPLSNVKEMDMAAQLFIMQENVIIFHIQINNVCTLLFAS